MRKLLPFLLLLSAVSSVLAVKPNVSNGSATGQVGVAFSFQISATNSPTSHGASGLPAGLGVNTATGLISGTRSVTGTYPVTASANNTVGGGLRAYITLAIAE